MPTWRGKLCPLCGPKMSIFCMVMSGWGIIFLGILGVFFYMKAGILIADVESDHPIKEGDEGHRSWMGVIDSRFKDCAYNCWIASALYLVALVGAFWQNKWNDSIMVT